MGSRKRFVWIVLALLVCVLIWRVWELHVSKASFLTQKSHNLSIRHELKAPRRHSILDSKGRPLAVSSQIIWVWIDPKIINPSQSNWHQAKQLLNLSSAQWKNIIFLYKNQRSRYKILSKKSLPNVIFQLKKLNLKGLYFKKHSKRFYPLGESGAPLLGILNSKHQGQEGLEKKLNQFLNSESQKITWVQNVKGQKIDVLTPEIELKNKNKIKNKLNKLSAIKLTINRDAQDIVYKALKKGVLENHADSGSAVLINTQTGDILALASYPSINPNNLSQISLSDLKNRAVLDQYEPGSVMKPFAMAAVLSFYSKQFKSPEKLNQFVTENTVNTSPGYIKIGRHIVRDTRNLGKITINQIIQKSSNIGIVKLLNQIPKDILPKTLDKFGFGHKTGATLLSESKGYFKPHQKRGDFELATLAFGYGLSATSLQLAQAYQILANKGQKISLRLLKSESKQLPKSEQILDAHVSNHIVNMMASVVGEGGTAYRARVKGLTVAGKTGTARKASKNGYADDQYIALFAGLVPAKSPKYAMIVMVDNPKGEKYYGGSVAAPIFAESFRNLKTILRLV